MLHWRDLTVEIHSSFKRFGVAADGPLMEMEENDITQIHMMSKKAEVVQTLDIKSAFVGVTKTWAGVVEVKSVAY